MKNQTNITLLVLFALIVAATALSSKNQHPHHHHHHHKASTSPSSNNELAKAGEREPSSGFLDYWKKHEKEIEDHEKASRHAEDEYYHYYRDGGMRRMTCDRFPRVCHVKWSPGPDCCRKACVDVRRDQFNCGMCGNKCQYPETCCNGRCVNLFRDRKNCGRCGNKCRRGSFCEYGMCSYA